MKVLKSDLEKVAVHKNQYPEMDLFEFAFAGRSNVGKSSFINSMLGRKNLARTSSTPGKTRTINFYRVNDDLRLVDLPGYGYARVSKTEKSSWSKIINEYLDDRENLLEVVLLVDIRHEPTEQDLQMYEYILSKGYSGIVIATKADKISRGQYAGHISKIAKKLSIKNRDMIIPFSSVDKNMVDEMWFIFEDIVKHFSEEEE
ncbi:MULTISPECIES: ribosome biogenesis GTP-binding protein YihA/YsxC [Peptoniphilus]|uniref:ribosome biogenesis GTP-binding protein YihA/YsxC n=1 Tax=Peptoniphilus TaxID=162289 RepID=UPI0001DA9F6A|nr:MULTISPECIES: ribosome biogenesis GTP-binding protein YihA/YsxC [Peptoniphilus]EFI41569.1 ribosome biogenesis GTP-binding protein YsxC [Peptoniphilus sp. oral taxon 386 str. F0131]